MPKNFVRKTFDRWLAHSAARFRHPPRVVLSCRDYFVLQFAGVTPAIECVIKKKGAVDIYHPRGRSRSAWDWLNMCIKSTWASISPTKGRRGIS
jgi:hypothetical protein